MDSLDLEELDDDVLKQTAEYLSKSGEFLYELNMQITNLKTLLLYAPEPLQVDARSISCALTKLDECQMWAQKAIDCV